MASDPFLFFVATTIGCDSVTRMNRIQALWSGYGEVVRLKVNCKRKDDGPQTVVVKRVAPPSHDGEDIGHERKLKSYEVESNFYRCFSANLESSWCRARVPRFLGAKKHDNEYWMVLEDVDASGYRQRLGSLDRSAVMLCLQWLAHFHAVFLEVSSSSPAAASSASSVASEKKDKDQTDLLWEVGTYWHLATRPDEFATMSDEDHLKTYAHAIDTRLNCCRYTTLVHGDAKSANFCFNSDVTAVAAVDFQYVGKGCGMKDVCYLLATSLNTRSSGKNGGSSDEEELLNYYFQELNTALQHRHSSSSTSAVVASLVSNFSSIEQEWRALYPFACADFQRFLAGWSPGGGWGCTTHTKNATRQAIQILQQEGKQHNS